MPPTPPASNRLNPAEALDVVTRRIEPSIDLALKKPRRGRPPGWLVELRARQEAA